MLTFIFGFIAAFVLTFGLSVFLTLKALKSGKYCYARFDEKRKEWRVAGQFASIANKVDDIRSGRTPGAIKYVD